VAIFEEHTEVISKRQVARDTFLLGLNSPHINAHAKPGQFVMIRVRPDLHPLLRRPFSICATEGNNLFFILYRVVGRGTALLSTTREGESLSVVGPLGKGFDLPKGGQKALLVAGGIGAAPLIFLAQHLDGADLSFLTGYRSSDEVIGAAHRGLESLRSAHVATDDGTKGSKGLVTELLEARLTELSEEQLKVFACGPPLMLKQVVTMTRKMGIPCQVSLEANMACGLGACQGCAVKASAGLERTYIHVCQDGPVFSAEQIDWKSL